jgi:DNA-binding beta-propeller fold protein YncE
VSNDPGDSLTRIDPATGMPTGTVHVQDPYNLYYTPDGKFAVVVAERFQRLDFRNPASMALVDSVPAPCRGLDHMDFSADVRFLIATCEFSGTLIKLDIVKRAIVGTLQLSGNGDSVHDMASPAILQVDEPVPRPPAGMPQDVKISPDGSIYYVADMKANGVHLIDAAKFVSIGFVPTGRGAQGLYVSRNSRLLYSVISFATCKVVKKWSIPGSSPDMGGVSADGKVLWLSGRYNSEVYALDTDDGHLLAHIPVCNGPHGLCVYPQPGRYSLGHTGIFR